MMPTLVRIPPELFGLPVFGFGWLLVIWILLAAGVAVWQIRRQGWTNEMWETLPLVAIVAVAIVWLLPQLAEYGPNGEPLGVAIRGFGVMMLLAILGGVGLSAYRAKQIGLEADVIPGLAFWMITCGIVGARLFFVIQYWHEFSGPTLQHTLFKTLNATQGGLVVYGSVIGGLAAAIVYLRIKKLPLLVVADVIAPGMILGQAIGRLGCFMNGCCFGGLCTIPLIATPFPAGSPPYARQLEMGELHGFEIKAEERPETNVPKVVVAKVFPGTPAEKAGVKAGDEIRMVNGVDIYHVPAVDPFTATREALRRVGPEVEIVTADNRTLNWSIGDDLPAWSLPVHPTQLYSFLDAGLLCLFLWFYYPYRRYEGEVFALLLLLHPISRILLEMLRADEGGQFGTSLTISQWLSFGFIGLGVALFAYLEFYGKKAPGQGQARPEGPDAAIAK